MNYYSGPNPPPYAGGYGAPGPYPPPYPPPYSRYSPPQPNPWNRPIRRSSNIACFGLIIVILLGAFMLPVFMEFAKFFISGLAIESPEILSLIDMFCDLVVYVLMFIIPLAIIRVWIGIPAKIAFPMRRPRLSIVLPAIFVCLGASVLGMLSYSAIVSFLESVFHITPYLTEIPEPVGIPSAAVYFIRWTIAPAILEELMFRGVIMQSLRRFGDMFALICSSVLFALAHHNLAQGINAMILGVVIGFFVLRTGSVKTGMFIHFIYNSSLLLSEFATKDMSTREYGVVVTLIFAFFALSGLICLGYLVVSQSGMFYLAPPDYPVSTGKKYSLFFLNAAPVIYVIIVIFLTAAQFKPVSWY